MKSVVDVRVASEAAATLTPSTLSLVNGDATGITVRTCVLREPLGKRIEMTLTVDHATAAKFSQACRRQDLWRRFAIPGMLLAAVVLGAVGIAGTYQDDPKLALIAFPLIVFLAIAVWIGRYALALLRSPHHPRLKGRHWVLIRGVDPEAARDWARLNSPDSVHVIG